MANIRINKGASLDVVFEVKDENENPIDFTDSSSILNVARTLAASTTVLSKALINGGTVGTLLYSFLPDDTKDLVPAVYEGQIKTTYTGSGEIYFSNIFSFIVDEVVKA